MEASLFMTQGIKKEVLYRVANNAFGYTRIGYFVIHQTMFYVDHLSAFWIRLKAFFGLTCTLKELYSVRSSCQFSRHFRKWCCNFQNVHFYQLLSLRLVEGVKSTSCDNNACVVCLSGSIEDGTQSEEDVCEYMHFQSSFIYFFSYHAYLLMHSRPLYYEISIYKMLR